MELVGYFPRVVGIEKRVSGSTKFASRLSRPPRPPMKIKTVHVRPGQADPPGNPGTLTIVVMATEREILPDGAGAFTPAAGAPIATAAAGPGAPASRRTKKAAPRPKRRRATKAQEIARLERELAAFEAKDEGSEPG